MTEIAAAEVLKQGDPRAALKKLQEDVRTRPSDAALRVFLCQLLMLTGQWQRGLDQLSVLSQMDVTALPMMQTYTEAIRGEIVRREVFEGTKAPVVLGEPEPWLALLIEAVLLEGRGQTERALKLRAQAFEQAPPTSGSLDGQPFEWIADADARLGPVLEAVMHGKYYWIPFARFARIAFEAPSDLRDAVWMPAHFEFINGGEAIGLVPTRYAGSEASEVGSILLARETRWEPRAGDTYHGLGQRELATDGGEKALMDIREIVFAPAQESPEGSSGG